jgi:hypothetical protein
MSVSTNASGSKVKNVSVSVSKETQSEQEKTLQRSQAKIENFKRLATARVNKSLVTLSGVAQLSNRNSYTYEPAQVQLILNVLKRAVNDIEAAFTSTKESKSAFTL